LSEQSTCARLWFLRNARASASAASPPSALPARFSAVTEQLKKSTASARSAMRSFSSSVSFVTSIFPLPYS